MPARPPVCFHVILLAGLTFASPGQAADAVAPTGHETAPTIQPQAAAPRRVAKQAAAKPMKAMAAPDTLPDDFVLARVADRSISVYRFIDAYFASYGPVRPKPDSLGRVEFLNSMINKEVLGLTALKINRPLAFEDRTVMREYSERVLSNALYRHAVLDSIVVGDDEVRKFHAQFGREQRYRRIRFDDPNTAASVRRQLAARTLAWNDAVKRGATIAGDGPDGDTGFLKRGTIDSHTAQAIWELKPGEISEVVTSPDGFLLMQMVESRNVDLPAYEPLRRTLLGEVRDLQATKLADRLQREIGRRVGMAYDTTNIRWAAARFHNVQAVRREGHEMVIDAGDVGGDLAPDDTARVLARHKDGSLSLGTFLVEYNHQSPMMRQPIGDFESFRAQLDAIVLEPYMAEEARARGLDRDSAVMAQVELKREELLVDHLFADSVQSRIYIKPAERKRYYNDHIAQFVTYPVARYAAIVRPTQAGAESVMARIKAGEPAAGILRADSLAGIVSGSIKEARDEGRGGEYHKILFGELRPGQSTVVGPDKQGDWMVLNLLDLDPGHQLPYEQVESMIDESMQNIRAEQMLNAMLKRLRKRYRIEAHPELVMRILLHDPATR